MTIRFSKVRLSKLAAKVLAGFSSYEVTVTNQFIGVGWQDSQPANISPGASYRGSYSLDDMISDAGANAFELSFDGDVPASIFDSVDVEDDVSGGVQNFPVGDATRTYSAGADETSFIWLTASGYTAPWDSGTIGLTMTVTINFTP